MVMDPSGDYAYILSGPSPLDDDRLDKVDLTGTEPVIVASYDLSDQNFIFDGQPNIAQNRAVKMDIDTSDENLTDCRIFVTGCSGSYTQYYMNIYRFDSDLNLLGSSTEPFDLPGGHYFWGMGLDMENKLISHVNLRPYSASTSYYGVSEMPSDW
jgi:hypothetical protein